ncbi:MAG: calcium/calmodulin-dependent protein kinase type 1 isoform [Chlamydiales bacterium]|jgi:serine/threonine protein kinase|nr:calcium/calmodulin-dependent protein kinase type 1 isoform [Chlamydiales bacterium]
MDTSSSPFNSAYDFKSVAGADIDSWKEIKADNKKNLAHSNHILMRKVPSDATSVKYELLIRLDHAKDKKDSHDGQWIKVSTTMPLNDPSIFTEVTKKVELAARKYREGFKHLNDEQRLATLQRFKNNKSVTYIVKASAQMGVSVTHKDAAKEKEHVAILQQSQNFQESIASKLAKTKGDSTENFLSEADQLNLHYKNKWDKALSKSNTAAIDLFTKFENQTEITAQVEQKKPTIFSSTKEKIKGQFKKTFSGISKITSFAYAWLKNFKIHRSSEKPNDSKKPNEPTEEFVKETDYAAFKRPPKESKHWVKALPSSKKTIFPASRIKIAHGGFKNIERIVLDSLHESSPFLSSWFKDPTKAYVAAVFDPNKASHSDIANELSSTQLVATKVDEQSKSIKELKIAITKASEENNIELVTKLKNRLESLKDSMEGIVRTIEVVNIGSENDKSKAPGILMKLYNKGSLGNALTRLSIEQRYDLALQALKALRNFHDLGLIHGDIKPDNLMLHQGDESNKKLKLYIADFGFTQEVKQTQKLSKYDRRYIAPDILNNQHASQALDVYAMGNTLLQIFTEITDKALGALFEPELSSLKAAQHRQSMLEQKLFEAEKNGKDTTEISHQLSAAIKTTTQSWINFLDNKKTDVIKNWSVRYEKNLLEGKSEIILGKLSRTPIEIKTEDDKKDPYSYTWDTTVEYEERIESLNESFIKIDTKTMGIILQMLSPIFNRSAEDKKENSHRINATEAFDLSRELFTLRSKILQDR